MLKIQLSRAWRRTPLIKRGAQIDGSLQGVTTRTVGDKQRDLVSQTNKQTNSVCVYKMYIYMCTHTYAKRSISTISLETYTSKQKDT